MDIIPENFQKIIMDMTEDLSETFPEYSELWTKWSDKGFSSMNEAEKILEVKYLYEYIVSVYPEQFFDIIYQNEKIFSIDSSKNTLFLPGIDFKLLFNCEGVSVKTREIMWNYLKLVLLTVVESVKDKSKFGTANSMFDGINENELFEKLKETMNGMTDFFKNLGENENNEVPIAETNVPKVDDIFGHLKSLFDGKIGLLAKELAEEISGDLSKILGDDEMGDVRTSKDVISKLMKNPGKVTGLLKTVNDRLQSKINSGEISQEELMKEATEIMQKMKGVGGMPGMSEMAGMAGMSGMGDMGGMGGMQDMIKNLSKMGGDLFKNKVEKPDLKMTTMEKMKNRILLKKIQQAEQNLITQNKLIEIEKNYQPYKFTVADDLEKQSKSSSSNKKKKTKAKK
jgi:hypothetical protein